MQHIFPEIDCLIERAKQAESFADSERELEAKENWQKIAASWRLLAERTLADRTGGQVLLH